MKDRKSYSVFAEQYRSKGETQIARFLERSRIHYLYEYPTAVLDEGKTKVWYPDFTLPEYGMIIEYFGMNGDSHYDRQTLHKMEVYNENGIEGLFLTSDDFKGNWPGNLLGQIEGIQKARLDRFYNR